jgi:hypothetical protein
MKSKISIILVFVISIPAFSQSDIKIITSDRNSLVIEYTPNYSDSIILPINNENYINVGLVNGYITNYNEWGAPAVPVRLMNIGVPSEYGNTIQVLSSTFKEISGKIIPIPKPTSNKGVDNFSYEINDNYLKYNNSNDLVSFGKYGLSRNVPTQQIIISPVKFYEGQNKIQLYTKIIFQINFSQSQIFSLKPASDLLQNSLVNYSVAKYWSNSNVRLKKGVFNSVLATGTWVRVETSNEGIYKITKSMMSSYGFDVNSLDPRTIKIYNNGGKVLPEDFNAPRPSDLQENAIIVVGQDDGKFDDSDYVLFYGRGNSFWDYDTTSHTIKRYFHPYSTKNYYWITVGGAFGKRIQNKPSLNISTKYIQPSTKAFASIEDDKQKVGPTGREYVGDAFTPSSKSYTYTNKLDGRLSTSPINYTIRFIDASPDNLGLLVQENSSTILSQYVFGYGAADYELGYAYIYTASYSGILPENRSVLQFNVTPGSSTSIGYLDYVEINYDRDLNAANDNLIFFSKDTTATIEYDLGGFTSSNIQVFDVTDYANVKIVSNPVLQSGGDYSFQSAEIAGKVSHYVAVGSGNYLTPSNAVSEPNSNLHDISTGAKFIIITSKDFIPAANRLKAYRETQAKIKMSTIVVDVQQIFNEFSGGLLDVSGIRDFIKYAFDNWQIKPEYVLFFGKGTYDYKNVEGHNNNFVPVYETQESLYEINSYSSDDFFVNVSGNDAFVDLAAGRITVQTADEANSAVDKIINYETNSATGTWRNLITLVADDGYTGNKNTYEGAEHTAPSETLANTIIPASFDLNKIYMAAYPVVITAAGRRMPTVNTAIEDAMNSGTAIINFIGHGSPSQWAQEDVFDQATTIPLLHNSDYFFVTAATCDFGYYDMTNSTSSAEELLLLNNSGCIGSFTATRLVYSSLNHLLMYEFFNDLLNAGRDSLNLMFPIGKALFAAKQIYNDVNAQKYQIIGDPTLRLNLPEYTANIDSVDGKSVSSTSANVQVQALSNTRVNGTILHSDNTPWSDFNGEGVLTVFDSQYSIPLAQIGNYPMVVPGGIIFNGRISVTGGKFSANFVVPKDISYANQNGKIIMYYYNSSEDGLGFTNKIIVGGTDTTAVNDGSGPNIEIYFDNVTYGSAALINPNSTLIVKLSDKTGLNTTGTGVGHKCVGILNGDENNPIDFTNYFTSDINSDGKSGEINYPFNNLASGNYNLVVKAWDVFNNFSSAEANFTVVTDSALVIEDVYNYPDPFSSNTTFTFQQNLNKLLDVKIRVYTVAGRLIRQIEAMNVSDRFVRIPWDGRDQDGSPIANGTYLYKIIVRTVDGSYSKSVLGKMAVIR